MSARTPGGWEFYGPSSVNFVFDHEASVGPDSADGRSGPIAIVGGDSDEMAMANAQLIAAAPDLLAACLAVVEGYEGDGMEGMRNRDHVFYKLCKKAVTAARPAPAGGEEDAR